jgi:hypothetical protein
MFVSVYLCVSDCEPSFECECEYGSVFVCACVFERDFLLCACESRSECDCGDCVCC